MEANQMMDDFCLRLKRHVLMDAQGFCKVTEPICEGCGWKRKKLVAKGIPKPIPHDISDRELDQVLLGDLDYWVNYYTTIQHNMEEVSRLIALRKKRLDRLHLRIGWDSR